MENQIVCPNCKQTIPNNDMIDDAVKGTGPTKRHMLCACGEKITYWQITAQLRDQQRLGRRFHNWVRSFSNSRAP